MSSLRRLLSPNIKDRLQVVRLIGRQLSTGNEVNQDDMPPIPEYIERHGESMEVRKARLLYQSRKRGMLENGLLLSSFAAKYLGGMNECQLELYDKLINKPSNDWEIYYWAVGNKPTPDEYKSEIMDMLKEFAKNKEQDIRITQPNLST